MKASVGDFLAAIFLLALVYVLVRPRSRASEAVRLFGDAVASLVRTVTNL